MTATLLGQSMGVNAGTSEIKDTQKSIEDVTDLKLQIEQSSVDGFISEEEKEAIINSTPDAVVYEYLESLQDEIKKIIESEEPVAVPYNLKGSNEDFYSTYTYHINEAVDVSIEIEDEEDEANHQTRATVTAGGTTKKLGDRKTTGTYKESLFGMDYTKLKLTLGYTVNKKNMKTRYSSTTNSTSVGSLLSSSEVTDRVAKKVGHDMNCNGSYTIEILGYATTTIDLALQVKWDHNIDNETRYITYKLSVI